MKDEKPAAMRPPATRGLRHLALNVKRLEECLIFYCDLLGMTLEWQPDEDNFYLTSGHDNLALHRATDEAERGAQALDHLGFIMGEADHVNQWYDYFRQAGVELFSEVKNHRDGARSFYCADPDGNVVQMIYHPPLAGRD